MTSGPEAALLQYVGTQGNHGLDPMLQQQLAVQQMQQQQQQQHHHHHQSIEQFQPRPFTPQEAHYMMHGPDFGQAHMHFPPALAASLEPEDRRRKSSAATATNDKELRELLARNEARALRDVAQEVIQKERTPQAEKTKQLFAMLW